MCAVADGDTGPGSELLPAVYTTHARYNTPAVVCNISTSCLQGSHWDTPKYDEGYIGDVDKASSRGDEWDKASSGSEAADISEVVLTVDLKIHMYLCGQAGISTGERSCASRAPIRSGCHDDGEDTS